ncbi:MAG: DUF2807 domain-containing protein [Salinivirgaceae bacterium]|nr:DUF2807 domain-containing protein [Salinivirgaceae bacterium]
MSKHNVLKLFAIIALAIAFMPNTLNAQTIKGNGKIKTEVRQVSGFNRVVVQGQVELFLSQETSENVKIESEENLVSLFKTSVSDSTLYVFVPSVKKALRLNITVAFKDLKQIVLLNEVTLNSEKVANFDNIEFICGDASRLNFEFKAANCVLKVHDSGNASLRGYTENLTVDAHDETEVNAFDLQSDNCNVIGSGYAEISVNAKKKLAVTMSGSSNLYYMGEANIWQRNFTSSGLITKRKTAGK